MLTLHSFLQKVFQFVRSLIVPVTKKMYRTAVVITAGSAVVAVVTLTSNSYGGGGRNALAAVPDEKIASAGADEEEIEEIDQTEAKIQVDLTESKKEAQLLVGSLLTKEVQQNHTKETIGVEALDSNVVMQAEGAGKETDTAVSNSVIPYSNEDYEIMLKIVEAEAGDCGEKGKILVANVIVNRVKSDRFPDTITDVVYQKRQFSPVASGRINKVKVSAETIECVNRALAGEDYSEGALFFMMRSASDSSNVKWFDNKLKWLFKYGVHEFFTYY